MLCAAIPYRMTGAGELEVLLVTSRGKGLWILPKGKVKPGKTAAVSAREEAYEEAGAVGSVSQPPIDCFDLSVPGDKPGPATVSMQIFSLKVDRLAISWPEMFQRRRRWVQLREAAEAVKGAHFRAALKRFGSIMEPIAPPMPLCQGWQQFAVTSDLNGKHSDASPHATSRQR
jgi:8-oxo-dGTP pyrophosphatase MutT (NUDIX family)